VRHGKERKEEDDYHQRVAKKGVEGSEGRALFARTRSIAGSAVSQAAGRKGKNSLKGKGGEKSK